MRDQLWITELFINLYFKIQQQAAGPRKNRFKFGMKLEAVDKTNQELIRPAIINWSCGKTVEIW